MKFLDWYLKIAVVSALVGASMEMFMVKTGFCVRTLLLGFIPDSQSYPFVFLFFYELDLNDFIWNLYNYGTSYWATALFF